MLSLFLSPLQRWIGGGLLLLVVGLSVAMWAQKLELKSALAAKAAALEKQRLATEAIQRLEQDAEHARRVISDQAAVLAQLESAKQEAIREIVRTIPSSQCAGSAVVGHALERLRNWPAAGRSVASAPGRAGTAMSAAPDAWKNRQ